MIYPLLIALAFLAFKHTRWLPLAGKHAGCVGYYHRYFRANPFHYFMVFPYPGYFFVFATAYGVSRRFGQVLYDLMLTATGLLLYVSVAEIFHSPAAALAALLCFYAYSLAPAGFSYDLEPEALAAFFASSGLALTCLALKSDGVLPVFVAACVAGLSMWGKVSPLEHLWSVILVFAAHPFGPQFFAAAGGVGLVGVLLMGLMWLPKPCVHEYCDWFGLDRTGQRFAERVRFFLEYQDYLLFSIRHSGSKGGSSLRQSLAPGLGIVFPLPLLFVAYLLDSGLTRESMVLLSWVGVSALQCILRKEYGLLYWIMALVPMAVGGALWLEAHTAFWAAHPAVFAMAAAAVLAVIAATLRATARGSAISAHLLQVKREVIDPLRGRVVPDEAVFVNGHDPEIYYELGVSGPPILYLWAGYYTKFFFGRRRESRKAYKRFFTEQRPRFFIDFNRDIRMDYLAANFGLHYRLDTSTTLADIYELERVEPPVGDNFDIVDFYTFI